MRLLDLKVGMNPRRVRNFPAKKGHDIPCVEINLHAGTTGMPAFRAINPMGTIPVLELDDGTFLAEPISICRYFEALYPDPPLFGTSALGRALIDMWTRRMAFEIARPIVEAFTHTSPFWAGKRRQVPAIRELACETARAAMIWLDGQLAKRPFFAGNDSSMADIAAKYTILLGRNTGTPVPSKSLHLQRWYQNVTHVPSARA